MGINAAYLAFEVGNIRDALYAIRGLGIRGASITIPFKTSVIPFLMNSMLWLEGLVQ